MKKIIIFAAVLSLIFCSCSSNEKNEGKAEKSANKSVSQTTVKSESVMPDIEITEVGYVTMINEVYNNMDSYIGKIVSIEGCFSSETYEGKIYYYVYRTGPGCCGNDGSMCGFEFVYDGTMPAANDWIKVTGELFSYIEGEQTYLSINASSVDVLTQRGLATVSQ